MTAALGCFDMERRERNLEVTFSITFQFRNRNSPFAAFLCTSLAWMPPTIPYKSPQHSFLHFLSLLGFVHSGPLHRGLYTRLAANSHNPCFTLIQACCFYFMWDDKSSFAGIGGWEGNQLGLAGGWGERYSFHSALRQAELFMLFCHLWNFQNRFILYFLHYTPTEAV